MIFSHFSYLRALSHTCVRVCVCESVSAIKCLAFACFDCNYSPRRVRHLYFHFFVSAVSLHAFVVCVVLLLLLYLLWVACVPRVDFAILKVFTQSGRQRHSIQYFVYVLVSRCSVAGVATHSHVCMQMHTPVQNTYTDTHQMRRRRRSAAPAVSICWCSSLDSIHISCVLCVMSACVCKCSFVYVYVCVCASSLIYAFAETTSACNGIHLS